MANTSRPDFFEKDYEISNEFMRRVDREKYGDFRLWKFNEIICVARRHPSLGNWCGYADVPVDWACDNKKQFYGGLTGGYKLKDERIIPGFDCSHCWDMSPGNFKNFIFVKTACEKIVSAYLESK